MIQESVSPGPMPIQACTCDTGVDVQQNAFSDVHCTDFASCCATGGYATATRTAMSIRASRPWTGATPHRGMPRSASGRMAMYISILPSAAGSLPASSPCRKAIGRPGTGGSANRTPRVRSVRRDEGWGSEETTLATEPRTEDHDRLSGDSHSGSICASALRVPKIVQWLSDRNGSAASKSD